MTGRRIAAPALAALLSTCGLDRDADRGCFREGEALLVDRITCARIDGYWESPRDAAHVEPHPEAAPRIPVESTPLRAKGR